MLLCLDFRTLRASSLLLIKNCKWIGYYRKALTFDQPSNDFHRYHFCLNCHPLSTLINSNLNYLELNPYHFFLWQGTIEWLLFANLGCAFAPNPPGINF